MLPDLEEIRRTLAPFREKLEAYVHILSGFSGKVRLTGPSDENTLWNEHIMDCAYSLPFLPTAGKVIDVGTGGGLPGIVWAICRPDLEVHLLDSVSKKCRALGSIVHELDLQNTVILCSRSEDLSSAERETYDLAAARAVTSLGILAEYLSPLVSTRGRLIAFKGPHYRVELDEISSEWKKLGLSFPEVHKYRITDHEHYIIDWGKESPCPLKYPRRAGMAEKRPWWR
ncbi:MAG: 16S rRNA (guanine(527)-N(7))-methyltransferase RsmG [Synergistales bacterium]|nr:16S rRNA (guanine(527)-N(7))-methyltransferase RsmG [Synergistales bacterium]